MIWANSVHFSDEGHILHCLNWEWFYVTRFQSHKNNDFYRRQSKLNGRENKLLQEMYSPYAIWENDRTGNYTQSEDAILNMDYIYKKAAFDYFENIDM